MHTTTRALAAIVAVSLLAALTPAPSRAQTSPAPAPALTAGPSAMPGAATSVPAGAMAVPRGSGITADALAAAQQNPNDWLTYGRDLSAQRFSPLTQIDASNVNRLVPAWHKTLGPPITMEGTPIVSNGTMYVTTGTSSVFALDAKTGATKWSYKYPLSPKSYPLACCNVDNRGVTLTGDLVVIGTLDAHLVALDAATGKPRWNVIVANNQDAYSITSPPLPVKNMVLTGVGGGEYPTRGFIAAYAADSGKLLWKRYTIPGPGETGYDTWKIPKTAQRGGGPTWLPGTYDPQRDTVYWGTGNPNPDFDANGTKGDLLYTSSLLALDPNTGTIKWYYQFTPHNIWDYDAVNEPMLVDVPVNGASVAAIAHADRNGYLYLLNRDTGKLIYAVPFVDKVTWGKVDRTTGKIAFNAAIQAAAMARKPYDVAPSIIGGKNWEPTAYDPAKHLLFVPAIESSIGVLPDKTTNTNPKKGAFNFGGGFNRPHFAGSLSAWDLSTGKMMWKQRFPSPAFGGALATGGGLVFAGQMEGELDAFDETTGKKVWSVKTPSGINAPPMTYSVDGRQYVSVEVGIGGVFPLFFIAAAPYLKAVKPASMVYTYALPVR